MPAALPWRSPLPILIVSVVAACPATALAAELEDGSLDEGASSYEVTVTASRVAEEARRSERSVEVLNQEALTSRQARTTPEVLRDSPGVFVQQTNLGGGSPIIRGMHGPQVLLLIDGVRLNNSVFRSGPLQYLNLVDSFSLARLEVVRGPGSVLYGSDALGGTINALYLEPKDRRGEVGARADGAILGRYGSAANERTGHLRLDTGRNRLGATAMLTGRMFDDLAAGGDMGRNPFSGYDQLGAATRVVLRPDSSALGDWTLSLGYNLALMRDVGRADRLETNDSYILYQNDHHLVFGRAILDLRRLSTEVELTTSFQRFLEQQESRLLDSRHEEVLRANRDRVAVSTVGTDLRGVTRLFERRLKLTYGAELSRDSVFSEKHTRQPPIIWEKSANSPYPKGAHSLLLGGYLHGRADLLPPERPFGLALLGGYRLQQMRGGADATTDESRMSNSHLAHVVSVGIQTSMLPAWTTALTYSQGIRAPNLQESLHVGNTGNWYHVANSNLGPERCDTFEFMNRLRLGPVRLRATYYATFLSDFIERTPSQTSSGETIVDGNPVVENANRGRGRIQGFEGEVGVELSHWIEAHAALTWTEGVELLDQAERAADEQGRREIPLSRIPPIFGRLGVSFHGRLSPDFRANLEPFVLFADRQKKLSDMDRTDPRIPEGGTPSWVTINLRGALHYRENLRLALALENLTNDLYKYHGSGVYGAGTNAILSLELRY